VDLVDKPLHPQEQVEVVVVRLLLVEMMLLEEVVMEVLEHLTQLQDQQQITLVVEAEVVLIVIHNPLVDQEAQVVVEMVVMYQVIMELQERQTQAVAAVVVQEILPEL
tara:strand:+ start:397 stop:720 length:324 start_codon:yes stop_codon:yes gene_type:complete